MLERTARKLGAGKYADEFEVTLNRAAEESVPEAATVFAEALKKMTLADAQSILSGPPNAATQYFRKTSSAELTVKLMPIVKRATKRVGATRAYSALRAKGGLLLDMAGAPPDIDAYVTAKALDGVFLRVAQEEGAIRRDPAGQASALLKKVFGRYNPHVE